MENKIFNQELYNDEFFEWHLKYARDYSIKTMDWYLQNYPTNSIVDFGCGIGSYLESAFTHNLKFIKGYDIGGEHAAKYTPEHIKKFITYKDCTQPIRTEMPCDLVISFETAEHIEPSGTDMFVDNLYNATRPNGGKLLFTGAPPEQDGCGHINCYPKQFWIDKFVSKNLSFSESETKFISEKWRELGAPNYICDNLLVFHK